MTVEVTTLSEEGRVVGQTSASITNPVVIEGPDEVSARVQSWGDGSFEISVTTAPKGAVGMAMVANDMIVELLHPIEEDAFSALFSLRDFAGQKPSLLFFDAEGEVVHEMEIPAHFDFE